MANNLVLIILLVDLLAVGGFMLLYPRITRKGLLFGVYVGEARARSDAAREITRRWYLGTIVAIAVALVVGLALVGRPGSPLGVVVPTFILGVAFLLLYLRAYRAARGLVPWDEPVSAAPAEEGEEGSRAALPWVALLAAVIAGVGVIAYTALRYDAMPDPMPTHFDIAGKPDAWSKKSVGAVMVLPLMTLVMGITVGGMAVLTRQAKLALRKNAASSLAAQLRFRAAVGRYLAIVGLLVTTMLASLAVTSVQVALGERRTLPGAIMLVGLALFVFALFGAIWLAIRYGQGGARLEDTRSDEPLTDGLADNRRWKLGLFYVDRDDPAWLVERRFGFGYTLNFGNPKAVGAFAAFIVAIFGLAAWAIVSTT